MNSLNNLKKKNKYLFENIQLLTQKYTKTTSLPHPTTQRSRHWAYKQLTNHMKPNRSKREKFILQTNTEEVLQASEKQATLTEAILRQMDFIYNFRGKVIRFRKFTSGRTVNLGTFDINVYEEMKASRTQFYILKTIYSSTKNRFVFIN